MVCCKVKRENTTNILTCFPSFFVLLIPFFLFSFLLFFHSFFCPSLCLCGRQVVNQEGQPLIEGKLKEKQVRWKFIKRWKTRYFTLAGNQLLFRRGKSVRSQWKRSLLTHKHTLTWIHMHIVHGLSLRKRSLIFPCSVSFELWWNCAWNSGNIIPWYVQLSQRSILWIQL